ncbi:MAG: uroporphyrinogen-III C-methyltransferase [Pseudomonadota bacterium]
MSGFSLPWSGPPFQSGTVWLVGAGPGDPGLLTLAALHALRQADVILYDALVGPDILQLARAEAVFEPVGKRAGKPRPSQQAINDRLIELAREGLRVLRLKGGDPFTFGRGGEEALALADAGIPFRVVPGVTAGIGGLGLAGVPVTQRGMNTSVTFVTGHGSAGDVPVDLDWAALALGPQVLVFYMALRTIGTIAERLIAAGKPPMTPVAVASNASLPEQSVLITNLARAASDITRLNPGRPAIIAVGEVALIHNRLAAWQQVGPNGESLAERTGSSGHLRHLAPAL